MGALQGAAGGALGGFGIGSDLNRAGYFGGSSLGGVSSAGTRVPTSYGPVGPLGSFGGLY